MTKTAELSDRLDARLGACDKGALEADPIVHPGSSVDLCHLASILGFLNHEIRQSADLLRDLTACLSNELCALGDLKVTAAVQQRLAASTVALQNEDRVQQRLGELRKVISILAEAMKGDRPAVATDLDHTIIDQLCLEEIRCAFALSVGMAYVVPETSSTNKTPSVGDIDLF